LFGWTRTWWDKSWSLYIFSIFRIWKGKNKYLGCKYSGDNKKIEHGQFHYGVVRPVDGTVGSFIKAEARINGDPNSK